MPPGQIEWQGHHAITMRRNTRVEIPSLAAIATGDIPAFSAFRIRSGIVEVRCVELLHNLLGLGRSVELEARELLRLQSGGEQRHHADNAKGEDDE